MTGEKLFLLDVLKSFIHGEKLNFDTELDWGELLRLSQIHSVAGILGYMSMQNPCERTERIADLLKRQCFASIAVFDLRSEQVKLLSAVLSGAGIDHMLFKGCVVRDLYPVPELRSYGDVDVLIRPEDRKKCHELMLNEGFEVKTDWEPVYGYHRGMEAYELHTEMLEIGISDKSDPRGYFSTAWEHSLRLAEHVFEPTREFHFIYLLAHIAKHVRGSGAGIRMYMDLAAFIRRFGDSVDWAYIESTLRELGLGEFTNTALTVVEKCLGVKSPIALREIKEEIFEGFMDLTLDGGVFGQTGHDGGLAALKRTDGSSRAAVLMRRLFPKAETIESRYTYLQGRRWLLPAAWVHRVFKNRDAWGRRASELRSIMNTGDAELTALKEIYKQIGL